MTKTTLVFTACALVGAMPLQAQTPGALNRPLNESELMKTIDSLGTGDPARKAPLSILAEAGSGSSKKEEKSSSDKAKDKSSDNKEATEITAKEASFDQKAHQAVFAGDVVVKNPEFNISCDKLTAFLRNDAAKDKNATPGTTPDKTQPVKPVVKPVATPAPATPVPATPVSAGGKGAGKSGPNTGGLEKAIAEGSVVITQDKVDADGTVNHNVGHGRRAVYEASTGDVTLTGRPEVQQGINTCIALDDSTVMILNREGRMKVTGPHKTVIKDAPENPPASNGR